MKFSGQSSVQVQPHTNLEDLKTVTTISLFIRVDPDKDPIEDRFIFYLGDRNVRRLRGEEGQGIGSRAGAGFSSLALL